MCGVTYYTVVVFTVYVVVESMPWSSPGGRQRTLGQTLNIFEHVLKNVLKKNLYSRPGKHTRSHENSVLVFF